MSNWTGYGILCEDFDTGLPVLFPKQSPMIWDSLEAAVSLVEKIPGGRVSIDRWENGQIVESDIYVVVRDGVDE